jgi:proline iminopeptidase
MQLTVNGTRLFFDVDGARLVPDGPDLRARPTVVLVHGGPGGFDHAYLKSHFAPLTAWAQVVYLDLRDHGRSRRHDPAEFSFDACAEDLYAFCVALEIERPVVLGHSLGGMVVLRYAIAHPDHPGALVLQSTMARFDLARLVEGFRAVGGDELADLARRDFAGEPVTVAESDRVYAAFGPRVPDAEERNRTVRNPAINAPGMDRIRTFDTVGELGRVSCPALVCVGRLDPVTPLAAAREIVDGLAPGLGRLEVIDDAGHFPWLDRPDAYWTLLRTVLVDAGSGEAVMAGGPA